jgi:hypothetical protein
MAHQGIITRHAAPPARHGGSIYRQSLIPPSRLPEIIIRSGSSMVFRSRMASCGAVSEEEGGGGGGGRP